MLGCPGRYTAELRTRDGRRRRALLPGLTHTTWERALGVTSQATLAVTPTSRACAAALAAAVPWSCEVALWRDHEQVWAGPLTDTDDASGTVTLTARDVTCWLDRRIVHDGYDTTDRPADAVLVAAGMLADAYGPDDPRVIGGIVATAGGPPIARTVDPETVYAAADLAELVSLGLGWTVVGRSILLFPAAYGLGHIPPLGPRHFSGDAQRLAIDGSRAVTRAVVQGGGVRAEAGGIDPVFGLLEYLDTQASFTTEEDAALAAAAALARPVAVLDGGGGPLTARAPVTVAQLVPGALCAVTGRGSVLSVTGAMQLTKVAAEWSAAAGETITPTFAELWAA